MHALKFTLIYFVIRIISSLRRLQYSWFSFINMPFLVLKLLFSFSCLLLTFLHYVSVSDILKILGNKLEDDTPSKAENWWDTCRGTCWFYNAFHYSVFTLLLASIFIIVLFSVVLYYFSTVLWRLWRLPCIYHSSLQPHVQASTNGCSHPVMD